MNTRLWNLFDTYNTPWEKKSKQKNQFSIILQNILRTVKKVAEDRKLKKKLLHRLEYFISNRFWDVFFLITLLDHFFV